ncbi:MAG: amidohydrolase family protein [Daejeonella sp.]
MSNIFCFLILAFFSGILSPEKERKVFDVHIHGSKNVTAQLSELEGAGVYKAALSTSWDLQNTFRGKSKIRILYGLMLPCPNGKVPYSLQPCYETGQDWPSPAWIESRIKAGEIDYFGEVLSQYYGISASDSLLFPYYALAEKYDLPVGIHMGGAGPGHGSPAFRMELGNPQLLKQMLSRFPDLRLWIMHGGDQFYREAISIMQTHRNVYADLSVISNPDIIPGEKFRGLMKAFIEAGLEDKLMFGSDNGDIGKVIRSVESLDLLSEAQKKKIFYANAERFFKKR